MLETPAVNYPVGLKLFVQEELSMMTKDPSSERTHRPQYGEAFGEIFFGQHHWDTKWWRGRG